MHRMRKVRVEGDAAAPELDGLFRFQERTVEKLAGEQGAKRDAASGQATGKRQHAPMTLAGMDTDKDGRVSRAEFAAAHAGKADKFAAHDGDGDGFVTQAELDAHHAQMKANKDAKAKTEGKCGEGKCGEGKCGGGA